MAKITTTHLFGLCVFYDVRLAVQAPGGRGAFAQGRLFSIFRQERIEGAVKIRNWQMVLRFS